MGEVNGYSQDYGQYAQQDVEQKSWFRRHWILTTVLILIIIAIVSGFLTFQYSSVWGSHKGPLAQAQTNQIQSQLACPKLSNLAFYAYSSDMNSSGDLVNSSTWVVKTVDYGTKDEKLVYVGAQEEGYNDYKGPVIFCENGSTFIENGEDASKYNPDYIYCGNIIMPIALYKLDSKGNIINNTKTSVQIVFDSKTKSYVTTRCGAYDVMNAP